MRHHYEVHLWHQGMYDARGAARGKAERASKLQKAIKKVTAPPLPPSDKCQTLSPCNLCPSLLLQAVKGPTGPRVTAPRNLLWESKDSMTGKPIFHSFLTNNDDTIKILAHLSVGVSTCLARGV